MKKLQQMNMALEGPDSLFVRTTYPEAVIHTTQLVNHSQCLTSDLELITASFTVSALCVLCPLKMGAWNKRTGSTLYLNSCHVAVLTMNREYLVPQVMP